MDESSLWIVVIALLYLAVAGGNDLNGFGLLGAMAIAGWFIVGEQAHH